MIYIFKKIFQYLNLLLLLFFCAVFTIKGHTALAGKIQQSDRRALPQITCGTDRDERKAIARRGGLPEDPRQVLVNQIALSNSRSQVDAQILNNQGVAEFNAGQWEAARSTWEKAEKRYRTRGDVSGIFTAQINQAQALRTLGLYRKAKILSEQINQDLARSSDSSLKVKALHSLGITLQLTGDLHLSQAVLRKSLTLATRLDSNSDVAEIEFSLANTARAMGNFSLALELYSQVTDTAINPLTQLRSQLNQFSLLKNIGNSKAALSLIPQIQTRLLNLPPSHALVYAIVNFAENSHHPEIAQTLGYALVVAEKLNDLRGASYALGQLGHLYEQNHQLSDALSLTQKALSIAKKIRIFHT